MARCRSLRCALSKKIADRRCSVRIANVKALTALCVLVGVVQAHARIGDSLANLEGRYGESYVVGADTVDETCCVYGFDQAGKSALRRMGYSLFAVMDRDQVCRELIYEKAASNPINSREIQGILLANSLGMNWKPAPQPDGSVVYVRTDGAIAQITAPERLEILCPERAKRLKHPAAST